MQKNLTNAMPNKIINNLKIKGHTSTCLAFEGSGGNSKSKISSLPRKPIEYQACDFVNIQMHSTISKDQNYHKNLDTYCKVTICSSSPEELGYKPNTINL